MTEQTDPPKKKRGGQPGNRGNRRTGVTRGTRSRRKNMPWRDDPLILERVTLVRSLRAQGHTIAGVVAPINRLMVERGLAPVSIGTVREDIRHALELAREEWAAAGRVEADARKEHIDQLTEVLRRAWSAFMTAPANSVNRGSYLNTIRMTIESIAKFDGSMAPIKVEQRGVGGANLLVLVQQILTEVLPPEALAAVAARLDAIETVDAEAVG